MLLQKKGCRVGASVRPKREAGGIDVAGLGCSTLISSIVQEGMGSRECMRRYGSKVLNVRTLDLWSCQVPSSRLNVRET